MEEVTREDLIECLEQQNKRMREIIYSGLIDLNTKQLLWSNTIANRQLIDMLKEDIKRNK